MFALGFALCALGPLRPSFAGEVETTAEEQAEEEEEEDLQQRLTEREDKRRPLEPWTTDVAGHPLTLSGEYEVELEFIRDRVHEPEVDGKTVKESNQFLLQQQLEVEAFYTLGEPLSFFVQVQGIMEEDLLGQTFESVSDLYVERGEMWLYSADVLGSGLNFDVGRLDFEDDRRWWWDEELDAARIGFETDTVEITLALAYELASERSDRSEVDAEHERVLRWISESSWDFSRNHSFQLFLLHQDDHSPTEPVGQLVAVDREDDSDARLTWAGARQTGIFDLGPRGYLGYWLDAAVVRGREHALEFLDPSDGHVEVEEVERSHVRGWAFDAGISWLLPLAAEPRLFGGYAYGSERFRQTGLHANEAGFGGVELFNSYGLLLQPELSNIGIVTLGAGLGVLRSSSLDLVYHAYRLDEPAEDLSDSLLQAELSGRDEKLGHEVDLVLALEEWERFELDVAVAGFRTSHAFQDHPSSWVVGGFLAVRYAF
jgi:alginate production protein